MTKNPDKVPVSRHYVHSKPHPEIEEAKGTKHAHLTAPLSPILPIVKPLSQEEELRILKTQNNYLQQALKSVENLSDEQMKRNFELVWFDRNKHYIVNEDTLKKLKYLQNSPAHKQAIEQLNGPQREYYRGFYSGLLAAARMYKAHAMIPVPDVNKMEISSVWEELMLGTASKHAEQVEASRKAFPNTDTKEWPAHYTYPNYGR